MSNFAASVCADILYFTNYKLSIGDEITSTKYGTGVLLSAWKGNVQIKFHNGGQLRFSNIDNVQLVPDMENGRGYWILLKREEASEYMEESRVSLLQKIRRRFYSDFLGADSFFEASCKGIISAQEFNAEKFLFVKNWIATNIPSKNGQVPDKEQIEAIAAVNGHVLVVARAGSGKTTTLANRALFLLKHCRVSPNEMLILAFNRKAALEIRKRILVLIENEADSAISSEIDQRIKDAGRNKRINLTDIEQNVVDAIADRLNIALPHVMTFHALAYAIVHPKESILYDESEGESQGLSRVFQQVIDDHLRDPIFQGKIRELMLAHFRDDWEQIVDGRYNKSKEEFLEFRRSMKRESINGEYVKSYGEKIIANFLFEHNIAYKYEHNHWWGKINYRPDFTLFTTDKSGVIIEYFGLKGDADYDKMSENKRDYWKAKDNWTLIEFTPEDFCNGVDSFINLLKNRLRRCGGWDMLR
ncbi:hypothetical protein FACS189475_02490 [Betaproteobacteria bacterium]|nr:hypothetical protein FACS189475_02490 [Betaproteobacteria bacterium]